MMKTTRNGDAVVAESFLEVRAKLLEIAATLDRIDRASVSQPLGDQASEKRALLEQAIDILGSDEADRAARLQHMFSRDYETDWREKLGLPQP
jgi:hypothetical protein